MAGLAFPGKSSIHRELAETEAFIEAITDGNLRMRIRDKEPKDLDHALQIALLGEANTVERVIVEMVEAPVKAKEYNARSAQSFDEVTIAAVTSEQAVRENIKQKCAKMCDMLEIFVNKWGGAANAAVQAVAPPQPRVIRTCFKCRVKGHFSNQCKENIAEDKNVTPTDTKAPFKCHNCGGFGHIARKCPDNKNLKNEKAIDKLPAKNVRGIKGVDDRSMKEHPVYIRAQMQSV